MSVIQKEEVTCKCGERFEAEVVQSVSATEDPQLKDLLLAGELNVVKCPSCFTILYAERFVLYHDSSSELLAFVHPCSRESDRTALEKEMASTFITIQEGLDQDEKFSYQPILVFGLDTLCDFITAEEDLEDEVQVADALCRSLGLKEKRLARDAARRKGVPPIIPVDPKETDQRAALLKGLEKVLAANDRLEHYKGLRDKVVSDPAWTI